MDLLSWHLFPLLTIYVFCLDRPDYGALSVSLSQYRLSIPEPTTPEGAAELSAYVARMREASQDPGSYGNLTGLLAT